MNAVTTDAEEDVTSRATVPGAVSAGPVPAHTVSLNTDIGEGFGVWRTVDDEALLTHVTDANLACGFHGGDPSIMRSICTAARELGVTVGAHPGFRDLIGFGRRHVVMDPRALRDDVLYQLGAVSSIATAEGTPISYVKVHGALYHSATTDRTYAQAVLSALRAFDPSMPLMCQPGDVFAQAADAGEITVIPEGYADRGYTPEGKLVPRGRPGDLITDPAVAGAQAVQMATRGTVTAVDGTVLPLAVRSICVHSDSPGAVELAAGVRAGLVDAGVAVVPLPPRYPAGS